MGTQYMIIRPHGDNLINIYGKHRYIRVRDMGKINVHDKYKVLCKDKAHYVVEVRQFDPTTKIGLLHFHRWNSKFDYNGPLSNLYLAPMGIFYVTLL
jgi:hypothetical protein